MNCYKESPRQQMVTALFLPLSLMPEVMYYILLRHWKTVDTFLGLQKNIL